MVRLQLKDPLTNRVDASDIVQETMIRAHETIDQWRGENDAQLAQWLRTILERKIHDLHQFHSRDKRDVKREVRAQEATTTPSLDANSFRSELPSPSNEFLQSELAHIVAEALSKLSEEQQEAFILNRLQGISIENVAQRMGKTLPAIAGLLRRATESLAEAIDAWRGVIK